MQMEKAHPLPTKKVAIVQSNYIPWKGYFDLIASVDEFIIYDDMQYTRRDWRNRNVIKTAQGAKWLTVPVKVKGKYHQTIRETEIDGDKWRGEHFRSFCHHYARAPHFEEIRALIEPLYQAEYRFLSHLNRVFLETICGYLGISATISNSRDYVLSDGKSERLADLCKQAGGSEYVSGPAAKDYLDESVFASQGITVSWFDYSGYPPYPQLWGEFSHGVTVLDMLFNCGKDSRNFMKWTK